MLYDVIPSDDFRSLPSTSDNTRRLPTMTEPRFKIFPISFRLPLSTNQKAARTMVTQVPPNAATVPQVFQIFSNGLRNLFPEVSSS